MLCGRAGRATISMIKAGEQRSWAKRERAPLQLAWTTRTSTLMDKGEHQEKKRRAVEMLDPPGLDFS